MSRQPLRVPAIGVAPDDLEFYCGGTLANCRAGRLVVMAVVTNGDIGSATHSMEGDRGHPQAGSARSYCDDQRGAGLDGLSRREPSVDESTRRRA
ncbi:MAG: hypothetical protein R2855_18015 [Thermomicrobiales bacterium]